MANESKDMQAEESKDVKADESEDVQAYSTFCTSTHASVPEHGCTAECGKILAHPGVPHHCRNDHYYGMG